MFGFVALNLVIYACLIQSTSISVPSTKKKGLMTWPTHSGNKVKLWGRRPEVDSVGGLDPFESRRRPVSTTFLAAIIISMSQSWKRSTTSAHVI